MDSNKASLIPDMFPWWSSCIIKMNPGDSYYPGDFWSFSEIEDDSFTNMGFATIFNATLSEANAL